MELKGAADYLEGILIGWGLDESTADWELYKFKKKWRDYTGTFSEWWLKIEAESIFRRYKGAKK